MHVTYYFDYQRGAWVRLPSSIKEGPGVVFVRTYISSKTKDKQV